MNQQFQLLISEDQNLFLETDRLILEPITVAHVASFFPLLQDHELYKFISQNPPTIESLEKTYSIWTQRKSLDGKEVWLNWAAKLKSNNLYVGHFQAGWDEKNGFSVAYTLGLAFHGNGFATEVLASIISFLRIKMNAASIKAWIDSRNEKSIQLVERLGFHKINFIQGADNFKGAISDEFIFEIRTKSLNSSDYDLGMNYGDDLKGDPQNPSDTACYADVLVRSVELSSDPKHGDQTSKAKALGLAGSLYKSLKRLVDAEKATSRGLQICDNKVPRLIFIQQAIRYYDVLRFQNKFSEAESGFKAIISEIQSNENLSQYEDVAFQHLGKLFYDTKKYEEALNFFNLALKIRTIKNNPELIESTEIAIKKTKAKLIS